MRARERWTSWKHRDERKEALLRLGILPGDLKVAPAVTALLRQAGSLKTVLEALRGSADSEVQRFLAKYDSLSQRERKRLPLEAIAISVHVDPTYLLGAATFAMQKHGDSAVKILALSHHPAVMRKRITCALQSDGVKDRDALQTGLGFLPSPKGSDNLNRIFPSLEETQKRLLPRRTPE